MSSTAGLYVYHGLNQAAYGTSKAALNFLTIHLASEFRLLNVRVNATAPNTFRSLCRPSGCWTASCAWTRDR